MRAHGFGEFAQGDGQRQAPAPCPLGLLPLGAQGFAGRGLGPLDEGALRGGPRVGAVQHVGDSEQPGRARVVPEAGQQVRRAVDDGREDGLGAVVGQRLPQGAA